MLVIELHALTTNDISVGETFFAVQNDDLWTISNAADYSRDLFYSYVLVSIVAFISAVLAVLAPLWLEILKIQKKHSCEIHKLRNGWDFLEKKPL